MAEQTHPQAGVAQGPQTDLDRAMDFLGKSQDSSAEEEEKPKESEEPAKQQQPEGPADEPTPDDIPDDVPAQPETDAFEIEIVHDGQQRKLNREDTIKYARQGFDYTQKTQQLAAKDRHVETQIQRLAQVDQIAPQLQGQLATVKALEAQLLQYQGVNWVQEAANDSNRYAQLRAQFDQLRDTYGSAVTQYQRTDTAVKQELQAVQAQRLQAEHARMGELVPEWKDGAKLESAKADISKHYASRYGIDPGELNASVDTAFKAATLYKAMKYDQLVASKADKSKQLRTAPPVARPGAVQGRDSVKADKDKELSTRLQKSGDLQDAAALLFNRMK